MPQGRPRTIRDALNVKTGPLSVPPQLGHVAWDVSWSSMQCQAQSGTPYVAHNSDTFIVAQLNTFYFFSITKSYVLSDPCLTTPILLFFLKSE